MEGYKDTWGNVGLWGSLLDLVHPEDISLLPDVKTFTGETFKQLSGIVKCINYFEDYLVIKSGAMIIRIKPEAYSKLPVQLTLEVGDWVRTNDQPSRIGLIYMLAWHFKNNHEYYCIKVNGTRKSNKWYRESDLEKLETPVGLPTSF